MQDTERKNDWKWFVRIKGQPKVLIFSVALFLMRFKRSPWDFTFPGVFADLVDVAGAHGDQEVAWLAVFQKKIFDFVEVGKYSQGVPRTWICFWRSAEEMPRVSVSLAA